MAEVADTPASVKHAALMLHALAAPDCEWALSQLPAPQQAPLREALAELRSLGIPSDVALSRAASHAARQAAAHGADFQAVEAAPAANVVAALQREPESVRAAALSLHDWPWQDEVRSRLRVPPRVDEMFASFGPAFRASMTSALADRLPRSAVAAEESGSAGRLRRWVAARRLGRRS